VIRWCQAHHIALRQQVPRRPTPTSTTARTGGPRLARTSTDHRAIRALLSLLETVQYSASPRSGVASEDGVGQPGCALESACQRAVHKGACSFTLRRHQQRQPSGQSYRRLIVCITGAASRAPPPRTLAVTQVNGPIVWGSRPSSFRRQLLLKNAHRSSSARGSRAKGSSDPLHPAAVLIFTHLSAGSHPSLS